VDTVEPGSFGIVKFNYKALPNNPPVSLCLDQLSWRFLDKTIDGTGYLHAWSYIMVTKLEKVVSPDGTQSTTMQKFIKGNACEDDTMS
jgi:hypothetical protein